MPKANRKRWRAWAGIVGVALIAALYLAARRGRLLPAFWRMPGPHPRPAETREERWQQDLHYLARELPRLHVNAYHTLSRAEFQRAVRELDATLPALSDRQATLELVRLVARIGDAHTQAVSPPSNEERLLPVRLYWFADGIFVVDAMPEAEQAIGARLRRIGGTEIEQVCAAIKPLIAHETEQGYKNRVAPLLVDPELLADLGLARAREAVSLSVEDATGARREIALRPVPADEYESYFNNPEHALPVARQPLYRRHPRLYYWFEYLPQGQAIYFQYDRCAEQKGRPLAAFYDELLAAIEAEPVQRLIVDLRLNGGGNSALLDPFIERVAAHPLNQPGKLFVLVGRGTFSSAVLNALQLRQRTEALFAGAPTAGSANHYGEVKRFELPNSGMRVYYSTKYFGTGLHGLGPANVGDYLGVMGYSFSRFPVSEARAAAFMPDLVVEPTGADHFAGRDPVLEAVLAYR